MHRQGKIPLGDEVLHLPLNSVGFWGALHLVKVRPSVSSASCVPRGFVYSPPSVREIVDVAPSGARCKKQRQAKKEFEERLTKDAKVNDKNF